MKKLLALVALLALLIVPASAYTFLNTTTPEEPHSGSGNVFGNAPGVTGDAQVGVYNITIAAAKVTHTEMFVDANHVTHYPVGPGLDSGSYSGNLIVSSIDRGDYTATWVNTTEGVYFYTDYVWNIGPLTGTQYVILDGLHENIVPYATGQYLGASTKGETTIERHPDSVWLRSSSGMFMGWAKSYSGTAMVAPVADFNCTPTQGQALLRVHCVDNSTGPTTTWNWSGSGGTMLWDTPQAKETWLYLPNNGNYTVKLDISNDLGIDNLTKSDYIWVFNSTDTLTLGVTAINSLTGNPIQHAGMDLYDVENTSWTNTTDAETGTGFITTLKGHHVNAYASAAGFDDNDKTGIPVENLWDSVLLYPPGLRNVSAGNVTLYVYVYDSVNHAKPIKGAAVVVIGPSTQIDGYTNDAGLIQFTVKNQTTYLIDVKALGQGYKGATQSVSSGLGSGGSASVTATFYLSKNTVTQTPITTTLPGGGTPTTSATILPGCEDPTSAACQASQNNFSMAWLSQNALLLIQVAFIFTILYIAGWKP